MSTIAERVAKGAALLDEHMPGWWKRIDLNRLEQVSPCGCVLGQLWTDDKYAEDGGYWPALVALGIPARPAERPAEYGFAEPTSEFAGYAALDDEWTRLIKARRAVTS
jgi:hypothetical protein